MRSRNTGWGPTLAPALWFFAGGCFSGDRPDRDFDTHISNPAYSDDGPRVLFDEAHHNIHRAGTTYRPFVELIEADGYEVARNTKKITREVLEPFSVFIIVNALGTNDRNDDPAFDPVECDIVRDWVSAGSSLLLITDHYPTGHAVERLAQEFGIRQSKGVAEDSTQFDPGFDETHIVYSAERGGLGAHPIIVGRDLSEKINRVLTFTGQGISADPSSTAFLKLSETAVVRPAEPVVERRGGDVIVNVHYGDAAPGVGWAQGLALDYGKGRVVVMGEAAMLSALLHRYDKRPIGMNVAGYDNRQLALNIMHWLTRVL